MSKTEKYALIAYGILITIIVATIILEQMFTPGTSWAKAIATSALVLIFCISSYLYGTKKNLVMMIYNLLLATFGVFAQII